MDMALRIYGHSKFRGQVRDALNDLCLCFEYALRRVEQGNNRLGELVVSRTSNRAAECECYCAQTAGCNLILDLVNAAGRPITIGRSRGGTHFDTGNRNVHWNPKKQPKVAVEGGTDRLARFAPSSEDRFETR